MICRDTSIRAALKSRQRGFLLNPYRFGSGAAGDPHFANVGLLLHMDGANGGTTFTDSSSNAHTVTPTGVTTSTAQIKWGTASALIAAASNTNRLEIVNHTSITATTEDFTIEAWVYFTSVSSASIIYNKALGTGVYPWQVLRNSSNKIQFRGYNNAGTPALIYDVTGTTTVTTGQWYFIQARRSGETFALAINGSQEATTTLGGSTSLYTAANNTSIGNYSNGAASFPVIGHIDEARFTKGVARAFELPTAAFPNS